jgi:predicted secreted hydrolase
MKSIKIFFIVLTILFGLSSTARAEDPVHAQAKPYYDWHFPTDHGSHPRYQTEWWYYVGHLKDTQGRKYGFQLTFFRVGLDPDTENPSAFTARDLYFTHFAVTDLSAHKFWYAEKMNRSGPGLAGASQKKLHLWNEDWQALREGPGHHLRALADPYGIDLVVQSPFPPVLHGQKGYSRKGPKPENSSLYYSFPLLFADGQIQLGDEIRKVKGKAWMDHEFFSGEPDPAAAGWNWFGLQLSDNSELMLYLMRQKDGSFSPASSGTWINSAGKSVHLRSGDFFTKILETWKSPHTGTTYPIRWEIKIPSLGMDLEVRALLQDQELNTAQSTRIVYWEGAVQVSGSNKAKKKIEGEGYMELTGYDKPFEMFKP